MAVDVPPKDRIYAQIGVTFLLACPIMCVLGVWVDERWWASALISFVCCGFCGWASVERDKALAVKWRKERSK